MALLVGRLLGQELAVRGPDDQLSAIARWMPALGLVDDEPAGTQNSHENLFDLPSVTTEEAIAELTRFAIGTSELLCLHAGVVRGFSGGRERCLAIPGISGAGKTTLTAALLVHGLDYLSDEVLAVDRTTLEVTGFARAISLNAEQWSLLGIAGDGPGLDEEWPVPPGALATVVESAAAVTDVLLPVRRPGPAILRPCSPADAAAELLRRCFNHFHNPSSSIATVAAIVGGARLWRATYQQATELVPVIHREIFPNCLTSAGVDRCI